MSLMSLCKDQSGELWEPSHTKLHSNATRLSWCFVCCRPDKSSYEHYLSVEQGQFVCLSVCMSVCLSVCMSVCLSVCLSLCSNTHDTRSRNRHRKSTPSFRRRFLVRVSCKSGTGFVWYQIPAPIRTLYCFKTETGVHVTEMTIYD